MKDLGKRIKTLRLEKGFTREEFCGDESELSVRQLARIESGETATNILKMTYIAKRLGVSVGQITDDEYLELPKRYKELKYLILRTPTYKDGERIKQRENEFDEIYEQFYDNLPKGEQLIVEMLQSLLDTSMTGDINFSIGLLGDYFEQTKRARVYRENDLILINLYLTYLDIENFCGELMDTSFFETLFEKLLQQLANFNFDELFIVNQIVISLFALSIRLEKYDHLEDMIKVSRDIMSKIQDFNRMPILNLLEWKYSLFQLKDKKRATMSYKKAIMFSQMTGDTYLESKLRAEWKSDNLK